VSEVDISNFQAQSGRNIERTNKMEMSIETVPVPSQSGSFNLSEILEDLDIRLAVNRTVKCYKKLTNLNTTGTFLKLCQKENIIPPTYKIGLKLPRFTKADEDKAQNILKQASRNLMKISIESLEKQEEQAFLNHLNSIHELVNKIRNKEKENVVLD
jgi:hypothetical protein